MTSPVPRERGGSILWAASALILLAAFTMASGRGAIARTPVDQALPLAALTTILAAWLARATPWAVAIATACPVMFVVSVAIPDAPVRWLSYGLIVAVAVVSAAIVSSVEGCLRSRDAAALVIAVVILARIVPFDRDAVLASIVVASGAGALVIALGLEGRSSLLSCGLALAAGFAAPAVPLRAAAIPWLLAIAAVVIRRRTIAALVAMPLVALLVGRWSWPVAGAALLVFVAGRLGNRESTSDGSAAFPMPVIPGSWSGLVAISGFLPAALSDASRAGWPVLASALLPAVGSFVVRPAIGILWCLASMVLIHASAGSRSASPSTLVPAGVVSLVTISLFPWSGIIAASYPLAIGGAAILLVIAIAAIPVVPGLKRIGGLVGTAILLVVLTLPDMELPRPGTERIALRAGESTTLPTGSPARKVRVVLSGANVSGLEPGIAVGSIDVLDDRGRAWRRTVRVGELADWGAFRRDQSFFTRNAPPARPASRVEGAGSAAFVPGAGSIELEAPRSLSLVRVNAAKDLDPSALLHVEQLEVVAP